MSIKIIIFLCLFFTYNNQLMCWIQADDVDYPQSLVEGLDAAKQTPIETFRSEQKVPSLIGKVNMENQLSEIEDRLRSEVEDRPKFQIVTADSLSISSDITKKYNLSICAIFKNEADNLKEWIDYHCAFGVDHFYLYNVGSRDSFQTVLWPYILKGIVTLMNWPEMTSDRNNREAYKWAISTQIPAYENAVNFLARNETKWLIFLDINEFLECSNGDIAALLKEYDDYACISLSSDFFDMAILDTLPKKKLLKQSLERTTPAKQILERSVAKVIFKPDQSSGSVWPPYQCRLKPFQYSTEVGREELRINHYFNRNVRELPLQKMAKTRQASSEVIGFLEEDNEVRFQAPIYQRKPEFLRKIKQEFERK
jgi:hypothetical protein